MRQNGVAGVTKDQHETTRSITPLSLQNLHPRFKSGRRLQIRSANSSIFEILAGASRPQLFSSVLGMDWIGSVSSF
jgi:hypothetical protein